MSLDAARENLSNARAARIRLENLHHEADADGNWAEKLRIEIALTGAAIWVDGAEQKLADAEEADRVGR